MIVPRNSARVAVVPSGAMARAVAEMEALGSICQVPSKETEADWKIKFLLSTTLAVFEEPKLMRISLVSYKNWNWPLIVVTPLHIKVR